MKKTVKVTLISLCSLIGLAVVAVLVACWLIFTPTKLTKIVNSLSEKYILCESNFESVDLALVHTFPYVGVDVQNAVLVNPVAEAPDTLAHIGTLTVAFNLRDFLKTGNIEVRQILVDDVMANLYVAADGHSNFDIFPASDDTTESSFTLPEKIGIEKIAVKNLSGGYCDKRNGMAAQMHHLNLDVSGDIEKAVADAKINITSEKLLFTLSDSASREQVMADLSDMDLSVKFSGSLDTLDGVVKVQIPAAKARVAGVDYVTPAMLQQGDLLTLKLPVHASLKSGNVTLDESRLDLMRYRFDFAGTVALADTVTHRPLGVDMHLKTADIPVAELLSLLPPQFVGWYKNMTMDARVSLDVNAKGAVAEGTLPLLTGKVAIDKGSFSMKGFPMKFNKISAALTPRMDLSKQSPSQVKVDKLSVTSGGNNVQVKGDLNDVLGNLLANLNVKGDLKLAELMPLLPKNLKVQAQGDADVDMHVVATMQQLQKMDLAKMQASGNILLDDLDAHYDSIHIASPSLNVALQLPSKRVKNALLDADVKGGSLNVEMPGSNMTIGLRNPNIIVGLSDFMNKKQKLAASFNVRVGRSSVEMDSTLVYTDSLSLRGDICYDSTQKDILHQLSPNVNIDLHRTAITMAQLPEAIRMTSFQFSYNKDKCEISEANILWGTSDYHLSGTVRGLEPWINHEGMLKADLALRSKFADVDQLLNMFSGAGCDKDSIEQMRREDGVPQEAHPFIVPQDVDITFHTQIDRCVAFGNNLTDIKGGVTVVDGVAILDQVGFVCKAARMQLTGIYKSPRPNHLYLGMDFHLLDIKVRELIAMIPTIDTLVPMLRSFEGSANFHLAAECNLNAYYKPKMSTLLGAAAIDSKNLVVLDNETFSTIAKYMLFSKKTQNKIDSLDVELTVIGPEIKVYPFLISMDKYQVCASGRHNLDNAYSYHLEIIKCPLPLRVGVDVKGTLPDLHIGLGDRIYTDLFKPEKRNELQQRTMAIKQRIKSTLEKNVKKEN